MKQEQEDNRGFFREMWKLWIRRQWGILVVLVLCVLLLVHERCFQPSTEARQTTATASFTLPEIPVMLTSPGQRAEYLATHYWDNFDFANTTLIARAEITKQAFVDYIDLFPHTPADVVKRGISAMLDSALSGSGAMFDHFAELYEKYLHDPNSPFRQEDHYIAVLQSIIANECVDEPGKIRPNHQLAMALKNRPGNAAADFEYTVSNGESSLMSGISADYIILYFNNPDCHDCERVKGFLQQSPVVDAMTHTGSRPTLRVMAVYPDEDLEPWKKSTYPAKWINGYSVQLREEQLYDLKAVPALYLLDKDKRVVLEDAPVEQITEYLQQLYDLQNL